MRRAQIHGLAFVVGGADEDFVAARDGDLLELLDEFGEEGVGDLGDDEAEQTRLSGDEGACLGVGKVIEFRNGLPDPGRKRGIDRGHVIDGAGDRGDRDFGVRCDAADVDFGRTTLGRTFHACIFLDAAIIAVQAKIAAENEVTKSFDI
jgi:hypothetical protein